MGRHIGEVTGWRRRRGLALFYCIVALAALIGLVSLGVDFGRVQIAKSEAQAIADAAARAGAVALSANGTVAARAAAIAVAAENTVDGSPMVLSTSDIDVGRYSAGVFTNN